MIFEQVILYMIQFSETKRISTLSDKSLSVYPIDSSRNRRYFAEAGRLIAVGVVPFVETERGDMRIVSAVFEDGEPVVAPGTGEEDASRCDTFFISEAAVPEEESILLFQ